MDPGSENEEGSFEFDCPDCGTHITGGQMRCPKCGAEFVLEEVEEVECPHCGAVIPTDSKICPKCGKAIGEKAAEPEPPAPPTAPEQPKEAAKEEPARTEQDEEELKRLFPIYVADVKEVMELAKEHAIEMSECRILIDRAVKAGKAKELATAVKYVKDCNALIKAKIEERINADLEYLDKLSQIAKGTGTDSSEIDQAAKSARELFEKNDYAGALKETREGRKISEKVTGKYVEARELYDQLDSIIQNAERFYIDTREARRKLKESQEAEEHGDWTMMGVLAKKGKAEIARVLPEVTNAELKRAKQQLLEAKANGKDVSVLVKILKDAGLAAKTEKYDKALEHLIEFKSEMKRL